MATALATLMSLPTVPLATESTPLAPLARLRKALGPDCPQLLIKRDDLLSFAMGGNKVRKMQAVAAEAVAARTDTLITCGGVQSNHARVTAAAGAVLGLRVILVVNGTRPDPPTGNARLDEIFGADVRYVAARDERDAAMADIAAALQREGRRPFVIPLGASTPTGALGFARGVGEIAVAGVKADAIVHATSSGGTQSGLIAGCALFGLRTRVLGISADDPAPSLQRTIGALVTQIAERLGAAPSSVGADQPIDVDDRFVGDGYGIPTAASTEALELVARTEGIMLDPVYTAKAMAGLLARIRAGEFGKNETIVFWHTGGVPGLFA
jgi:1-aminocyclopropane-1-carboxylate deaminase/D-cysteine desulfhydrase-like pyridoxal-dependent ACC family enzyme